MPDGNECVSPHECMYCEMNFKVILITFSNELMNSIYAKPTYFL